MAPRSPAPSAADAPGAHDSAPGTIASSSAGGISRAAWMALIAAFLGWMFDGFEMGLFPLVARPALTDLLGPTTEKTQLDGAVNVWLGVMTAVFLVGAATGGVVFGWLGDRIGRVRAMTLSVLTYTIFMGLCGFSGNVWWMFFFRFIASLGMGGEWSLGVALVMESWPNRSRAFMAGLIGAASNVGFLTVALIGLGLGSFVQSTQSLLLGMGLSQSWVDYLIVDTTGAPTGWRLLMVLGAAPALLTFFIRIMVPESERWLHSKQLGSTSHWATVDMLGVVIGAAGAMCIILVWSLPEKAWVEKLSLGAAGIWTARVGVSLLGFVIALAGFTYPVIRYLQRAQAAGGGIELWRSTLKTMILGACLSGVALIGTWASLQNAPTWADKLVEKELKDKGKTIEVVTERRNTARALTQIFSAVGAIIGTIGAALVGNAIGRRPTYVLLCIGSLAASLAFFRLNTGYGTLFLPLVLIAGGITASFYGWLPLYLPELFRTQVRATGQGFSFNFGRILAAVGALQFGTLTALFASTPHEAIPKACSVLSFVYLVGIFLIWLAPETKGRPLPD